MITKLHISNFRSIKRSDIDLGKITVLTGANNSGKSSFIYALLALKNIVNNPNQSIDNFLTLPFINLGGFEQTVFNKNTESHFDLGVTLAVGEFEIEYTITLNPRSARIELNVIKPWLEKFESGVSFPYPANKNIKYGIDIDGKVAKYFWNGFTGYESPDDFSPMLLHHVTPLQMPVNTFSSVDFVPIRRGFTKPYFSPVPLQSQISNEDEIATLLSLDRDLVSKVAHYLEKIVDRSFSIYTTPGTANFYLQTRDRATGFTADLVNEGLGTNQLVTILAKVLQSKNKFICIDEPEIHLHPTIIDKLVSVLIEIAEHENKQFLVSTHSEHFISSLLSSVVKKEVNSEDIKVYYLTKEGKETKAEFQAINSSGQIDGGLKNFYDAELDNLKTLFNIAE